MTSGGRRNRNHLPVEGSARSEKRGYSLTALPAQGYDGPSPRWPLIPYVVRRWEYEDKRRFQVVDEEATEAHRERELELWRQAWRTPQACAWSMPSERWRVDSVAMWVRQRVICESSEASASEKAQLHRFADQIGMTTAGLREMGWKVAVDEVAAKAHDKEQRAEQPKRERRLRAVGDAQ